MVSEHVISNQCHTEVLQEGLMNIRSSLSRTHHITGSLIEAIHDIRYPSFSKTTNTFMTSYEELYMVCIIIGCAVLIELCRGRFKFGLDRKSMTIEILASVAPRNAARDLIS